MTPYFTAACAGALLCAAPARAQEPATVAEVIVTARKLPEQMLDVPVVETALSRQQLERLQAYDLKDVASLVPGLVLGSGRPAFGSQVSLRGVGALALDPAADQPIGLVLDGLQLSQGVAYASGLFDTGQIEVLKGPQPLFYGKGSTAGVIAIRSADPSDKVELIARTGHDFEADEWRSELIISGPVASDLKLRLASLYTTQQGYFSNPATGLAASGARDPAARTLFPSTGYQIRGTALWGPTSRFDARLKLNLAHGRTVGAGAQQYVLCPDGTGAPPSFPPFLGGGEDCKLDRTHRVVALNPAFFPAAEGDGGDSFESTQGYGTLVLNYQISPDLTLTSLTGYYNLHQTGGLLNLIDSTFAATNVALKSSFKVLNLTQEFRISSNFTRSVNFTLGADYERGSLANLLSFFGNAAYGLQPLVNKGSQDLDQRTWSMFGQLRWKIAPPLELAAGARWEDDTRSDNALDFRSGTPVGVLLARPTLRSRHVSPELTVTYKLSDEVMLFGALKRGYKPGSFTIVLPATPGQDVAFDDEKVEGGEVGLKARLFHRRLETNLAGYDYRYTNLQVPAIFTPENGLPLARTLNAGAALVYGVEFDVTFRPPQVEGLSLRTAANWNRARFKTFDNAPCYLGQTIAAGCDGVLNPGTRLFTAQDLSGTPLIRAPEWQVDFGLDYETGVGHGLNLTLSNNTHYSSKYKAALNFPYYQPSFIKTDLSLALVGPRDRWELAFIGKNLAGKLTSGVCRDVNGQGGGAFGSGIITGGTARGPAGVAEIACLVDRGREMWLRLTLRPG